MTHIPSIAVTAIISSLILIIEHYAVLPYVRTIWRTDLHILVRYIIGTLAMNGSLTVLFAVVELSNIEAAIAVITVVTFSGLATFSCYGLDALIARISDWYESFKLEAHR